MTKTTAIEKLAQDIDMEVGVRLRERRKMMGLSQTELGQAIGVSFQQIQKYERGTNRISSSALVLLASALKCAPSELLGDADTAPLGENADPLRRFLNTQHGPAIMHAFPALTPDLQRLTLEMIRNFSVPAAA
jgi:transcriptional regulator with XRE-family HTH domain